jgi:hypothetical protein
MRQNLVQLPGLDVLPLIAAAAVAPFHIASRSYASRRFEYRSMSIAT